MTKTTSLETRRLLLGGALVTTASLVACGRQQKTAATAGATIASFSDQPQRKGHDTVLALTPFSTSTHALWTSMRDEISDSMDVVTVEVNDSLSSGALRKHIDQNKPACVVTIGNQAVRTYRNLQRETSSSPPAVVAMSSFAPQLASDLKNTTGVSYEVPAVTSFVALRQVSERPLQKVGAVYRPAFASFVEREAELAKMEEVSLVTRSIEGNVSPRKLRAKLRELLVAEKVDAIWVLNDNALLSPDVLRSGWLPELERSKVPVIVGVSSLVNPHRSFGSIAVVPDHAALGVQVANLLYELYDEDWIIEDRDFELPLSVETLVDMKQQDILKLKEGAGEFVDREISSFRHAFDTY